MGVPQDSWNFPGTTDHANSGSFKDLTIHKQAAEKSLNMDFSAAYYILHYLNISSFAGLTPQHNSFILPGGFHSTGRFSNQFG